MGSVTQYRRTCSADKEISTHTLRGERDLLVALIILTYFVFQLTRSVGSVTLKCWYIINQQKFQLTRSVGSVTAENVIFAMTIKFQLTRSVGSVTLHIVYAKSHHHNRADILLKIT